MTTIHTTREEAFAAAITAIEALGIKWYQGEGACCYGCSNLSTLTGGTINPDTDTYFANIVIEQHGEYPEWEWVDGGDTLELTVYLAGDAGDASDYDDGYSYTPDRYETSEVTNLEIFHDGDLALITQATEVLTDHGFTIEWDGTERDTITINL